MFTNKTAWFSDSVKRDIAMFWVSEGGVISDWKTAGYLFSDDASCPDTERIHVSEEYLTDRATVFHSAYLSTCRLRQSDKSVPLGHYILPPVSVQKEVKARIGRFIWEQHEMLEVTTPHGNRSTEQISNIQPDATCYRSPLEKGNMKDFLRQDAYTNTPHLSREESVCCEAQVYPVNNMVTGYVHIDQLKKFSGELHDFLPFHSGYSVSRSRSSTLIHQSKKRKPF